MPIDRPSSQVSLWPHGSQSIKGLLAVFSLMIAAGLLQPTNLSSAEPRAVERISEALQAGYPGLIRGIEGNEIVWHDGSRTTLDDGIADKDIWLRINKPDTEDMFSVAYPMERDARPQSKDDDPGRIRDAAFFKKVYGDCQQPGGLPDLTDVAWLPSRNGGTIRVSKRNGVARQLEKVSKELEKLPEPLTDVIVPQAQGYNCRVIAGTDRQSAHGYGIAIDINPSAGHYWRWIRPDADGNIRYKNSIPLEVVEIFEKHGFIWGGKWYHFDTMHFEYRPELFAYQK